MHGDVKNLLLGSCFPPRPLRIPLSIIPTHYPFWNLNAPSNTIIIKRTGKS